jgi:hypothetical protein
MNFVSEGYFQFGPNAPTGDKYTAQWNSDRTAIIVLTEGDFKIRYEKKGSKTLQREEFDVEGLEDEARLVDEALKEKLEDHGWRINRG